MPTTGENIRRAREALNMPPAALAYKVGVDRSLVSHWEKDRRNPEHHLNAIADALGTTRDVLMGEPHENVKLHDGMTIPTAPATPTRSMTGMAGFVRWVKDTFGFRTTPQTVYQWVYSEGLPAYRNPLRKSFKGEPTLLFDRCEAAPWFESKFQRVEMPVSRAKG